MLNIVAIDLLPIVPIEGVDIIEGDFTDESAHVALINILENRPVDLVISDMAPNFSGIRDIDLPRAVYLVEIAFEFAQEVLVPGGSLLVKIFQGEGFTECLQMLKGSFKTVVVRKPKASRSESREVYIRARLLNKKERGAP